MNKKWIPYIVGIPVGLILGVSAEVSMEMAVQKKAIQAEQPQSVGCNWIFNKAREIAESAEQSTYADQAQERAVRSIAWSQLYLACKARYNR